jgi:hypothetical protein
VTADFNQCPDNPEEVAEAYVMGTLSAEQATAFQNHYVGCNRCAVVLQETAEYVEAMRAAAKKVREEPES